MMTEADLVLQDLDMYVHVWGRRFRFRLPLIDGNNMILLFLTVRIPTNT
jgi:hypothetical protein